MGFLSFFLFLGLTCDLGHGFGHHGFHFRGLEEPKIHPASSQNIVEAWIQQPIDHFNPQDNRTWSMRYLENAAHFKKGGPILIMLGGEWAISSGFLLSGVMYELATVHNAIMYYTEHRYYGKSTPTVDVSSKNLQYLSVDQALADVAYFIESKKKEEDLRNSKVIVFGGSYSGSMAAWARLKYPHLIQGALASSAPLLSKTDFYEYYEVVAESLRKTSEQCVAEVKAAFSEVEELFLLEDGPEKLKKEFNLCDVPKADSLDDVAHFMDILMETFASVVQYDRVQNGKTKIEAICKKMTTAYSNRPFQRLAQLVSSKDKCLKNSYRKFIEEYRDESWIGQRDIMRLWWYQTCTEFGNYQTTNSEKSVFGAKVPLQYFTDICVDFYGDYYDKKFLNSRVKRTNTMYGGLRPDLHNVIFTNGDIDPWHALSVLEDLNTHSPAILIKGASHCRDLYADEPTDSADLIKARSRVREIIGKWITS